MPKTIDQLVDIGRDLANGDRLVIETNLGTRRGDYSRFKSAFTPKKHPFRAVGGETEIVIPLFETAFFSVVIRGMEPLDEWLGALNAIPEKEYAADYAQSRILLAEPLEPGEKVLILYF